MSHSTGKFHITDSGDPHWMREGRDDNNRGIFWCGSFPTERAHADARRLVACWNACRHLSTDQLEAGDLDYAGCSTLADIRAALGSGERPMLGELAPLVGTVVRHREMAIGALQNAIKMLTLYTSETDELAQSGIRALKGTLFSINGGQG